MECSHPLLFFCLSPNESILWVALTQHMQQYTDTHAHTRHLSQDALWLTCAHILRTVEISKRQQVSHTHTHTHQLAYCSPLTSKNMHEPQTKSRGVLFKGAEYLEFHRGGRRMEGESLCNDEYYSKGSSQNNSRLTKRKMYPLIFLWRERVNIFRSTCFVVLGNAQSEEAMRKQDEIKEELETTNDLIRDLISLERNRQMDVSNPEKHENIFERWKGCEQNWQKSTSMFFAHSSPKYFGFSLGLDTFKARKPCETYHPSRVMKGRM